MYTHHQAPTDILRDSALLIYTCEIILSEEMRFKFEFTSIINMTYFLFPDQTMSRSQKELNFKYFNATPSQISDTSASPICAFLSSAPFAD